MSVLSKERLVEKHSEIVCCPENVECTSICDDCDHMGKMMDKLAEYEDLEEQGLLLRLPVAVGSEVYLINSHYTKCTKYGEIFNEDWCQGCEDECDSHKKYYIHKNMSVSAEWIIHNIEDIGKTIFLTQSEAEEKLRELEGK